MTCDYHRELRREFDTHMRGLFDDPSGDSRAAMLSAVAGKVATVVEYGNPTAVADLAFWLTAPKVGVVGHRGLLTAWACSGERCTDVDCRAKANGLAGMLIGPKSPKDSVGAKVLATLERDDPVAWLGVLLCLSDVATPGYRRRIGARIVDDGDGPPPEVL